MPPAVSAGLLLCRETPAGLVFLLGHPGGPYFARRDDGCWTLPKGLVTPGEDLQQAAQREFQEETGLAIALEAMVPLGEIRQKGGKRVHGWAALGVAEPAQLQSNTFPLEWPPRSGRIQHFPEIDRFGWFSLDEAKRKMLAAQHPFLARAAAAFGPVG